jgi:L-ascorbate metabolism protein UlaG (beta-lactamase superfamily)
MTTRIRFFGVAAYEIITSQDKHILIDPFLDENPGNEIGSPQLARVDLILVSHAAFDHLGDTEGIARRTGAPVICGGEVKAYLVAKGIPAEQIRAVNWGAAIEVAGIEIRAVESRCLSQIQMPDGTYASGMAISFVIHADPGVRFYHCGGTALFSDLKLIGQLNRPTIGCLGITSPPEITSRITGPGQILSATMNPQEGALAAQWLGLEIALPCNYINPDCEDVREFVRHLDEAKKRGGQVPRRVVALKPDETIRI